VERFARCIQARLTFLEPVLDLNVVVSPASFIEIQLIRTVDRNCLLDVAEELFEIDYMAVILVVAIQPVGSTDSLEQRVVPQLVVEVDVATAGCVKACKEL